MNQEKIGKFIADMRKKKKMTQEELANKIHVSNKAVSKWETGRGIPDYSSLSGLCEALDVSLIELLSGEKSTKKEKDNVADVMISSIKIYENSTRKKYFKLFGFIFFILIISLLFVLSMYWISNYNKVNIYNVSGSKELLLNGKIIFNPRKQTIIISKINYEDLYVGTNLEIETSNVNLKIMNKNNVFFETNVTGDGIKSLNYYLDKIYIEQSTILWSKDEYFLLKQSINNLVLVINYLDQKGENHELISELNLDEDFSNNQILY